MPSDDTPALELRLAKAIKAELLGQRDKSSAYLYGRFNATFPRTLAMEHFNNVVHTLVAISSSKKK